MAIIEIRKKVLTSRRGALISGKVLEGEISSDETVKGVLMRPFFGDFKVNYNFPLAIQGRNSIMSLNGKFVKEQVTAKAGDEILFQAQFGDEDSFQMTREISMNRGKMPLYLLSGSDTKVPDSPEHEQLLKEQEQLTKQDARIKEIWHPKDTNLGLVLQGGGVAGAFSVGALGLLDRNQLLSKKYLKSIGGASTGSLSAASLLSGHSLKDGNNTDQVALIAETNYVQLNNFKEMGTIRPETKNLMNKSAPLKQAVETVLYGKATDVDYVDYIIEQVKEELNFFEYVGLAIGTAMTLFGEPFLTKGIGAYGVYEILNSNIQDAIADEKDTLQQFTKIRGSLATLEPTRDKLSKALNLIDVEKHGIKLRIAMTSYETGATVYYTEDGKLLYPKYDEIHKAFVDDEFDEYQVDQIAYDSNNEPLAESATSSDKTQLFVEACLTSGAFPAIFDPKVITFSHKDKPGRVFKETFYDGGIRENLPMEQIRKTSVSSIIAIHNSPVSPDLITPDGGAAIPPFNFGNSAGNYSATEHATRSLDLINNEIVQTDMDLERSLELIENDQLDEVIHIAPNYSVVGLTETNPLRIKLTMFYGYLRAFDALFLAKAKAIKNKTARNKKIKDAHTLSRLTDEIVLGLSIAMEQPIDLAKNAIVNIGGQNWKTFDEICKETYDHIDGVTDNPDTYSLRDPKKRFNLKIAEVALHPDKARLFYKTKHKILALYDERVNVANTRECMPYENSFYNMFLKESFFNGAWQGADLYPLRGVKNIEFLICGQIIRRIQNIKGVGLNKGGGNFRVIHYHNKKKGGERKETFQWRQKLNGRIDKLIDSKVLIGESKTERQRVYNQWKRDNFVKN